MERKAVSGIVLVMLLIGMLTLAFNIQPVKAIQTIYIRPDGSIDPPTALIHRDGDLYTLTGDITSDADGIVIERNNMTFDGADHTLQGSGVWFSNGVNLSGRINVTVKDLKVKGFTQGILLYTASSSTIYGNNVANNELGVTLERSSNNNNIRGNNITNSEGWGINLYDSSNNNSIVGNNIADNWREGISLDMSSIYNSIHGNNIADNGYGIRLWYSPDNSIFRNDVTNNGYGIYLRESSNNIFYHNNFVDNTQQIYDYSWGDFPVTPPSMNAWDSGYPSGGNYWSDHITVDDYSGIGQDEPGSDGIVDEPYIIDNFNRDRFPFVHRSGWVPAATVDFRAWNRGRWVPAYIELPERFSVSDIDVSTVKLNDTISAGKPSGIGDYDNDGIPDLMVKFDRAELLDWLATTGCPQIGTYYYIATLTIDGKLTDGKSFEGSEFVRIPIKSK